MRASLKFLSLFYLCSVLTSVSGEAMLNNDGECEAGASEPKKIPSILAQSTPSARKAPRKSSSPEDRRTIQWAPLEAPEVCVPRTAEEKSIALTAARFKMCAHELGALKARKKELQSFGESYRSVRQQFDDISATILAQEATFNQTHEALKVHPTPAQLIADRAPEDPEGARAFKDLIAELQGAAEPLTAFQREIQERLRRHLQTLGREDSAGQELRNLGFLRTILTPFNLLVVMPDSVKAILSFKEACQNFQTSFEEKLSGHTSPASAFPHLNGLLDTLKELNSKGEAWFPIAEKFDAFSGTVRPCLQDLKLIQWQKNLLERQLVEAHAALEGCHQNLEQLNATYDGGISAYLERHQEDYEDYIWVLETLQKKEKELNEFLNMPRQGKPLPTPLVNESKF